MGRPPGYTALPASGRPRDPDTAMTSSLPAFPQRPIRIARTGVAPALFHYVVAAFLFACAGFLLAWQGPGLLRDWRIAADPVTVVNADIGAVRCTESGILTDCAVDFSFHASGQTHEGAIHLLFADLAQTEIAVVHLRNDPTLSSVDAALDALPHRAGMLMLVVGIPVAVGAMLLLLAARTGALRRAARAERAQTPVTVHIEKVRRGLGGYLVDYAYVPAEGIRRRITSRFTSDTIPFFLGEGAQSNLALATLPQGSVYPVILDEQLTRLDITEDERADIRAGR